MIKLLVRVVALAAVTALLPGHAEASTFVSGPFFTNSWGVSLNQSQSEVWNSNVVGTFDYIRLDWVSGAAFAPPALRNYTGGWGPGLYGQTDTFSWATGPSTSFFLFDVVFEDPIQATVADYFVYNGDELRQAQRFTFNSSGNISISSLYGQDPGRFTPVPEPGTLALLGFGLVGLGGGWIRRKRRTA